jgi:hypothetical protein
VARQDRRPPPAAREAGTPPSGSVRAERHEFGGQGDRPVAAILRDATIELVAMADGRYLIYYSWPDDV